jgi:uncharacterized membrane protein
MLGTFNPIPRLIIGAIALIVGIVIHQVIIIIVGVALLLFAVGQIAYTRRNRGQRQ